MAIKWGNIIQGSKTSTKGRIGISIDITTTETQATVTVKTYFWSMYALYDSSNSYYYDEEKTSATTYIGSRTIDHKVNSGEGWSTSNQTLLATKTYTVPRVIGDSVKTYSAKITGLENLGTNNVSSVYGTITIPSLASYVIYYDANGGIGAPTGQTKYNNVDLTLHTYAPTRSGYNFLGWHTSNTATTPLYQAGAKYTANASATLYAVWELAYTQPRVSNLSVVRCDANGNETETGTSAKIKFDWEVDRDSPRYAVYYKLTSATEYTSAMSVNTSGKSGRVEAVISGVTFSADETYNIRLNVADSYSHTSKYLVLNALFIPIDMTPDGKSMSFGEPSTDEEGFLKFAYPKVDLAPKEQLLYKGENFFGAKVLWSGNSLMNETHYIDLPKAINSLKNGIVLVFSRNGDYNIITYYVPKESVVAYGRTGWCFPMCTALFDYIGSKTLYISNTKIEGHADNDATGKNATSGITYHNEAFFLRYVYEV